MIDFEITDHLYKVATYYQLLGEKRKAKAFKKGAMALDGFGYFIQECINNDVLMELPGVGRSIAQAVKEIMYTGELALEKELSTNFPPFIAELAEVPKFGNRLLAKVAGINCKSINDFKKSLISEGIKLSTAASESLDNYIKVSDLKSKNYHGIPLHAALLIAREIKFDLEHFNLELVGQAQMKCERVKSIDFITTCTNFNAILKSIKKTRFCIDQPLYSEGFIKTIIYPNIPCTIKVVPEGLKGLEYFNLCTPESHLNEIKNYSNEYFEHRGAKFVFRDIKFAPKILTDRDVYDLLEIDYIPPEIRHLPLKESKLILSKLVSSDSIKGDYHSHTSSTDGIDDIESMLKKANSLGYDYLAITDHSQSLRVANGLSIGEVLRQHDKIDQLNQNSNTKLLKGIEVEILKDGSLDYPPEILKDFDIVVAAVHMNTKMTPNIMTDRIIKAIRNPNVHILAHPTGSLTSRPGNFFTTRDSYSFNFDLILKECAKHHVALEVNAFPERLDLNSKNVQKALSYGVKITIGSDAHAATHLSLLYCGIDVVRRAGCKNSDVLNTYTWNAAKKYLHEKPEETIIINEKTQETGLFRSTTQQNMKSLFGDLIKQQKTIVGIDLTASEERDTGWAVLRGKEVDTRRLGTDNDIINATMEQNPDLVSIDSPLALPYGRCCEKTDCTCRKYGITRFSERFLMSLGIGVFPCLIPSMVNLTMRGIRLARAFEDRGVSAIESYPGAAQDILGMPRKQRGISLLCESLIRFGINITNTNISHDELDAITSALVGYFFLSNQYLGLGDERENELIVPSISVFNVENGENKVIALTGETGSGKTTAALYLKLKYGFKSIRYSQIIAKMAGLEGKYDKEALQKAGLRFHKEFGQKKITQKLIEILPNDTHVVIDGLRWIEDLQTLQAYYKERLYPIMIECPKNLILKRLMKSPFFIGRTKKDIQNILTHEVESEIITLGFQIPNRMQNDKSFKNFYERLDRLVRNI